jgi:UDP-glucose 4-epimerase
MYGLPVTILRYFNSYGPREGFNEYRGVVPRFIERAMKGLPIIITGSGQEKRAFTFVRDIVKGTVQAAIMEEGKNQAFNIGTGVSTTIISLAETIKEVAKSTSNIECVSRRKWDDTTTREANIDKAKKLIGYYPAYDLTRGITETIEWYKEMSMI